MSEYPPSTTRTGALSQWDMYVERLRVQLPAAPEGLVNGYVRWAPWVAIVFGVITGVGVTGLWFALPLCRRARSAS